MLSQHVDAVRVVGGDAVGDAPGPGLLLPGSFNPLHEGHREMARIAAARAGCATAYELSVTNVDKRPLSELDIAGRLSQFEVHETIWLTRATTFLDKARLFPGTTFVVGADTIARVADLQYYDRSRRLQRETFQEIEQLGCRFLVFGRLAEGAFRVLSDCTIDDLLLGLCSEVAESEFRRDVSSTNLRQDF